MKGKTSRGWEGEREKERAVEGVIFISLSGGKGLVSFLVVYKEALGNDTQE